MENEPNPRAKGVREPESLRAESLQAALAEDNNSPAQAPGSLFFPSRGVAAGATVGRKIEQRGLTLAWEGADPEPSAGLGSARGVTSVRRRPGRWPRTSWGSRHASSWDALCAAVLPAEDAGPREAGDLPRGAQHGARGEPAPPGQPRCPGSQLLSFPSKEPAALGDVEGRISKPVGGC